MYDKIILVERSIMSERLAWIDIYKDFKSRFPRLAKDVGDYRPYSYMTIILYLNDGTMMLYDMEVHRVTILGKRWKED